MDRRCHHSELVVKKVNLSARHDYNQPRRGVEDLLEADNGRVDGTNFSVELY
jgi:hypothetical protein